MFSHFSLAPIPDQGFIEAMILHQQTTPAHIQSGDPWWAVDLSTLTLLHCRRNSETRYDIRHVLHPVDKPLVTTAGKLDYTEVRTRVKSDIFRVFPIMRTTMTAAGAYSGPPPPEWLLLNSLDGESPAVMHTTDPRFVALADPSTGLLLAPQHYSSFVDLSPEGWAYWWEDAQRAFETLAVESASAHGIAVPDAIRSQV